MLELLQAVVERGRGEEEKGRGSGEVEGYTTVLLTTAECDHSMMRKGDETKERWAAWCAGCSRGKAPIVASWSQARDETSQLASRGSHQF